jgi:hypothetical protein
MRALRVIKDEEPLSLTREGQRTVPNNGRRFNEELLPLINAEFGRWGTSVENIDLLVRYKAETRGIPTATELYLDARRAYTLTMKSDWFATLLDLLGNTGYIRAAARKTFFPY